MAVKLSLSAYIIKNGKRAAAIALVDQRIQRLCGLRKDDLPDSPELCNIVDEIEEALEQPINKTAVADLLSQIDKDMIEEMVFS